MKNKLDFDLLLAATEIKTSDLDTINQRTRVEKTSQLLELGSIATEDMHFGLRVGAQAPFGFYQESAPTLVDALE